METRLVKSLTSTRMLKALLIDWQRETQNDWTKTPDRGFDLRNSTSTHWTANSRSLCSTFLPSRFLSAFPGGEGAQHSFTRRGSAPRSQPLPLTVFSPYHRLSYPSMPYTSTREFPILWYWPKAWKIKGTPFVRSLSVKVIIVNSHLHKCSLDRGPYENLCCRRSRMIHFQF